MWLDGRGRGVGGEEGFSSGSSMADILSFKDKVRSVISGLQEDEFRAGRSWRILGGCQQQQHNRMREKNEGWYINRRVFTSQSVWQWAHTGEMVFSRPRKHSYLRWQSCWASERRKCSLHRGSLCQAYFFAPWDKGPLNTEAYLKDKAALIAMHQTM